MDALALSAFLDAARRRVETPIDAYDVAAWMAVTCLSEQSIAMGGHPVPFPDFTNGKWIRRSPLRGSDTLWVRAMVSPPAQVMTVVTTSPIAKATSRPAARRA